MNNTTSSSSHSYPPLVLFFVFVQFVLATFILLLVAYCIQRCLSCERSRSGSPSVRQDHGGGASVQVQVVIQRDGVEATAAATTYSQTNAAAAAASDDCCAVCLGEYTDGAAVRQLPGCRHVFHRTCVDLWLRMHSTCPLCRHSTLPPPPVAVTLTQPPPVAHQ